MRKIRLRDGTEYGINRCGTADGVLWINVTDTREIVELVFAFTDPAKTESITDFWTDDALPPVTYTGYTQGRSFHQQEDGVLISLEKGDSHGDSDFQNG